jgi:iron complex outermembrane receptor protein
VQGELTRRISAGLRVTNLTDEDYAERADFGFGSYRYFVGEPRSVYVSLDYRISP